MKNYYKLIKFLKKNLPLSYPIIIKRKKLNNDDHGGCYLINKKFIIEINKDKPEDYAIDILIHEYAHAMTWKKEKNHHGRLWGIAHSKVYREFLKCFNLENK